MKRSTERILTTFAGSLIRPPEVMALGESTDDATRPATSGASACVGGVPTPPGPLRRANTSGNGPSATARPSRWAWGGGSGLTVIYGVAAPVKPPRMGKVQGYSSN